MKRAWHYAVAVIFGVVVAGGALGACGGPPATFATTKAGPMPANQSWQGVYYNPVYGNLHLVETEGNIVGRWRRTDASHWGELSGTAEGNLFRFKWTEHATGTVGPSADIKGTGVFVYKMGENDIPELDGQYALEDSNQAGQWHCIKQLNVKPDLKSVNGENPTGAPNQDQWQ